MKIPLMNTFKMQIENLKGSEFQAFVSKLFSLEYGGTGYTIMRDTKDKGCDGIIESEKRVIACYGDDNGKESAKRKKDFKQKASSDFEKYKNNWQKLYPGWSIVINNEIDPDYDLFVKTLNSKASVIGTAQLLEMIENLKNFQQKKLGEHLKMEKDFFSQDYLEKILEDLLVSEVDTNKISYDKNTLISVNKKIEINYSNQDIENVKKDFESLLEAGSLDLVKDLISSYEDTDIAKIKNRILTDFNNLPNGNFKQKFDFFVKHYIEKYSVENDDDYLWSVKSLLYYLFEQCLIGKKGEEL
jgi:hypothetical protein